jgi:hypothetical protein
MTDTATPETRVTTGVCRASYVNVFKPREVKGDDGATRMEYSMALLIPKEDTETMARIKQAAINARTKKFGDKPPSGLAMPWHDGDGSKPNGGDYGPECKGHWVINVKANDKNPPTVVDQRVQRVLDPTAFVSGDYCRVSLNAFGYTNKRKGVSFGLGNIQVVRKGEPLGSQRDPAQDFEAIATESAGAGAGPAEGGDPWDV